MSVKSKLDSRSFVILAEVDPPKGTDTSHMLTAANRSRNMVDAFVSTDMPGGSLRLSSLGACAALKSAGLETVMQVGCIDRNRMALQGDLLAAWVCGTHSIVVSKGQERQFGDQPDAFSVDDLDIPDLIHAAACLNEGTDLAGNPVDGSTGFLIGTDLSVSPVDGNADSVRDEVREKQDRGADFFISSPFFDLDQASRFTDIVDISAHNVLARILVLKSAGMARYLDHHQEGVHVPESVIARIQKAKDRTAQCLVCAAELISAVKKTGFSGVVLTTLGWEVKIPEILSQIELNTKDDSGGNPE